MIDLDAQFKRAVAEYKAGNKDQARDLLLDIVDKDEHYEQAWLYLSALVGSLDEQQICLENVLAINPNNARAKKGLEKVKQQIAARGPATPPPSPAAPAAPSTPDASQSSPFSTFDWDAASAPAADDFSAAPPTHSAPIGAEFASTSGDSLVSSSPPADDFSSFEGFDIPDVGDAGLPDDSLMDWMNAGAADVPSFDTPAAPAAPANDAFAIPSSVDWDNSGGTPAYGSGRQVDLPSSQEYDDWVQNLNINDDDAAEAPAFPDVPAQDTESAPLFGDTGYMIDEGAVQDTGESLFGMEESADSQSMWGSDEQTGFSGMEFGTAEVPETGNDFDSFGQTENTASFGADSMFADPSASFDDASAFGTLSPFGDEADASAADSSGVSEFDDLDFSFDDDDDDFGDIAAAPSQSKPQPKAKKPQKAAVPDEFAPYFAQIPADIEAKAGRPRRGMMAVGILVLLALNAASFAMLLL